MWSWNYDKAMYRSTGLIGTKFKARSIGAIDIQDQHTFVDVAERHAGKVLRKMKGRKLRGRTIVLKTAD